MSYRNLRFLEYVMTNAIKYKCGFACDSKPKRGKLAHTRERRPQDVTDYIYLNDNKCTMLLLTEDGAITKIWSGYYSELLNETKRKGNY